MELSTTVMVMVKVMGRVMVMVRVITPGDVGDTVI